MTLKYKKIFGNVVIGAALFWILGFLADILIPLLVRRFGDPSTFYGYDGVGITIASCASGAAVAITLIICLFKSKKETAQNGGENEIGIEAETVDEIGGETADDAEEEIDGETGEEIAAESENENEHPE